MLALECMEVIGDALLYKQRILDSRKLLLQDC